MRTHESLRTLATATLLSLFVLLPLGHLQAATDVVILEADPVVATESAYGVVGQPFVLDGSRSQDDGVVRTYAWKQVSGPFRFTLATGAKISVVPTTAGTYVFELVATDSAGLSSTVKKVKVEVKHEYVVQYNETNLDFVNKPTTPTPESGEKGGTEDINIGVGELQESNPAPSTPGSVTTSPQGASADYLLKIKGVDGESGDEDQKGGNVEMSWKVEEGEKLTPVFLELDGVPGESDDDEAATRANDRLVNAGPSNGWPKGGVQVAVGDVNGLTLEQKQAFLATVKAWAEVKSEQDLQNFAVGVMMQEGQPAETLSLNYEKIKFTYNMPAKFFGFIPTSYKAEVSVDKGDNENWDFGRVKVKFPWYSFLMRKGTSAQELTQAVQQEGGKDHKDEIEILSWSFGAKAMQTISNVMKTKHDTAKNSIGNIR